MRFFGQKILTIVLLLSVLMLLQASLLSWVMGGFPNHWQFPLAEKISLIQILFSSNPATALQYVLKTPVVIAEQLDIQNQQIWGYYLMPASLLINALVAATLNYFLWQRLLRPVLILPISALLLSVLYLRVAVCCTTHPNWIFDVWLLANANQPLNDTVFWQDIYLVFQPWFLAMQFILAAASILFLLNQLRRMKFSSK